VCRVDTDAKREPGSFHLTTMFQLLSKHELITTITYGTVCPYCFHYFYVYHISKNSSKVSLVPQTSETTSISFNVHRYFHTLLRAGTTRIILIPFNLAAYAPQMYIKNRIYNKDYYLNIFIYIINKYIFLCIYL